MPFELAHLPEYSDGWLAPAPVPSMAWTEAPSPFQMDVRDLSHHHGPIRPKARSVEYTSALALGDEVLARFERDGFITGVPVLNASEVDELVAALEPLLDFRSGPLNGQPRPP